MIIELSVHLVKLDPGCWAFIESFYWNFQLGRLRLESIGNLLLETIRWKLLKALFIEGIGDFQTLRFS